MVDYYFYKTHSYLEPSRQSYLAPDTDYGLQTEGSSIEDLFQSKLTRTKSRIETLIEAIDRRKLIKEGNLYGIEEDLSRCQNLLFELGYRIYRRDRQWKDLETRKLDLFREKRLWRKMRTIKRTTTRRATNCMAYAKTRRIKFSHRPTALDAMNMSVQSFS